MRNTNRGLACRTVALVGSSLLAVALSTSPGYAGPDRADQGRHLGQTMAGQTSQLRAMTAQRSHGQGSLVQSNGSDDVECIGTVNGVNVDSVTVPPGALCVLTNSTVDGDVTAEEDSILAAINNGIGGSLVGDAQNVLQATDNRIRGNVRLQNGGPEATGLIEVALCDNAIDGNVSLQRNTGFIAIGFAGLACGGNLVDGNVSVTDSITNAPDQFHVDNNVVGGNVQVIDNRGNGTKTVQNNLINETLDCKDNRNPFIGTPNDADRARGQCAP